ncbi:MAG: sugar phosphate isomerase/epimerase [Fimbriimonadaceae bacterium]|nr:sugar phosphate isomerase/epimerase [Fimbriimonadaceae bacterium]
MALPMVGIQPIIFGDRKFEDPLGCLDEVRDAGFRGVESVNYFLRFEPEQVKQWFCDRGLVVPATHNGYADIADPAKLAKALDFVQAFGGRYVICSGTADRTAAGYDASCEVFNAAGRAARERGLQFLYHNHAWEFDLLPDGSRGIDRLIGGTDPALVGLNIDVYWVHVGGEDPAAFVTRYAARAEYFHFKDGGKDAEGKPWFCELGGGTVPLASALRACLDAGATWITYEQDRTQLTTWASLSMSRGCLRTLGL